MNRDIFIPLYIIINSSQTSPAAAVAVLSLCIPMTFAGVFGLRKDFPEISIRNG